jgi:hypothetical protein
VLSAFACLLAVPAADERLSLGLGHVLRWRFENGPVNWADPPRLVEGAAT